jgi:uroporphyrin-III C-methyltransferase
MKKIEAKITLVGAGPGDPELITLKGLKALQEAKVVVYDALVHPDLLKESSANEFIFVGKRKGFKALEQEEINAVLVQKAYTHGNVVRLKGGDSYVFGRGWEELSFAKKQGVEVDVIPGLSSSLSVPALAGIPVTHRNLSSSFHVVTGTLSDGSYNSEIDTLASLNGTLVVLMGLNQLDSIVNAFKQVGKSKESIAIILNGSLDSQQQFNGEIGTIQKLITKNRKFVGPGIIVVGEVVELQEKLKHENSFFAKLN